MALVLAPDKDGRTRTVKTGTFRDWFVSDHGGALAVDCETTGLEWDARTRLVQFGDSNEGFAIDVWNRAGRELVQDALKQTRDTLIFHNAGFDIGHLERLDVDPEFIWPRAIDTYVMAHVQNPDRFLGLKPLSVAELGEGADDEQKALRALMRKRKWTWATVPRLVLTPYGVKDTVLTHRLFIELSGQMSDQDIAVVDKEMEVEWAMWLVRKKGIRLDRDYALHLQATWNAELTADREWFAFNYDVKNPNANAQLITALVDQGWRPTATTPSGKPKLDKAVLLKLKGEYELVDRLLEYKRKTKWLAAYVDNCLEQVDEAGYVHASYNTLGAKTGRMSCSNPPLQQLPKGGGGEVRRLFVASPGNVIASVDYSAIELRLAGALSGEQKIIDAYVNGGDLYQEVADAIGCTRAQAKVVVLASLYGAGGKKIAEGIGTTAQYAQGLVDQFWNTYPTLSRWVQLQVDSARQGKPTRTKWGRNLKPHAPYAAPNAVIQGTAAEVMKEGLMRLWAKGLLKYVCAVVHDEVVLDVPAAEAGAIAAEVAQVLEDLTFACPLTAEPEVYGRDWGAGYAA